MYKTFSLFLCAIILAAGCGMKKGGVVSPPGAEPTPSPYGDASKSGAGGAGYTGGLSTGADTSASVSGVNPFLVPPLTFKPDQRADAQNIQALAHQDDIFLFTLDENKKLHASILDYGPNPTLWIKVGDEALSLFKAVSLSEHIRLFVITDGKELKSCELEDLEGDFCTFTSLGSGFKDVDAIVAPYDGGQLHVVGTKSDNSVFYGSAQSGSVPQLNKLEDSSTSARLAFINKPYLDEKSGAVLLFLLMPSGSSDAKKIKMLVREFGSTDIPQPLSGNPVTGSEGAILKPSDQDSFSGSSHYFGISQEAGNYVMIFQSPPNGLYTFNYKTRDDTMGSPAKHLFGGKLDTTNYLPPMSAVTKEIGAMNFIFFYGVKDTTKRVLQEIVFTDIPSNFGNKSNQEYLKHTTGPYMPGTILRKKTYPDVKISSHSAINVEGTVLVFATKVDKPEICVIATVAPVDPVWNCYPYEDGQ